MLREIYATPRNLEDPIQAVAFTELPWMLNIAQLWIDERPTMGSVKKAIENGFYSKSERHGYKMDFIVNYDYLRLSVEEAGEFIGADPTKKSGELGDTLFLLLHFANGAGILADDVVLYLDKSTLSENLKTRLSLKTRLIDSLFRKSNIPSIVKWHKENVGGDNIELLGAMSGDEAPWTLNRKSTEWCNYQRLLVSNWALVFATICQHALENKIPLLETIYQTVSKASYNFPAPFFKPGLTPFSSGPTSNNAEISCCRLFRKSLVTPDKTYIDQYHLLFDDQKVSTNPAFFRQWIHRSLLSIVTQSNNKNFRKNADWLLHTFKWESLI